MDSRIMSMFSSNEGAPPLLTSSASSSMNRMSKRSNSIVQATAQLPVRKRKQNNRGIRSGGTQSTHGIQISPRGVEGTREGVEAAAAGGWTDNSEADRPIWQDRAGAIAKVRRRRGAVWPRGRREAVAG
jgi:hypothetical protein